MAIWESLGDYESYTSAVDEGDGETSLALTMFCPPYLDPERRKGFRWLLRIVADYQPDDRGMPGPEAIDSIRSLETEVEGAIVPQGAVVVGSVMGAGRWLSAWYLPNQPTLDEDILIALRPHIAVREGQADEDAKWSFYDKVLAPDLLGLCTLANDRVRERLSEDGDPLVTLRFVDHFVYLPHEQARDAFAQWATSQGFPVKSLTEGIGLQIVVEQPVARGEFDRFTLEMEQRAAELGGEYDGWGCPVAKRSLDS